MVTKFNEFLNESIKTDLENTILGRSNFEYKGNTYRLNGYKYVYYFKDGGRIFANVNKEDANAVNGSGVAGVIADLDKVTFIDRVTPWSEERLIEIERSFKNRIENDKELYKTLKNLPHGLTEKEYEDIVIDEATDSAIKSMRNNKDYPYPQNK